MRQIKAFNEIKSVYFIFCGSTDEAENMKTTNWKRRILKFVAIFMFVTVFRIYEYDIKVKMKSGFKYLDETRNNITMPSFSLPRSKIEHIFSFNNKECELDKIPSTNWSEIIQPRFVMNPNKFLYPVLKNEPIDQLLGLRQSVLLALRLNRTLVLPHFRHHNRPAEHLTNPAISADIRINVDILRAFISTVPLELIRETCENQFDVILLTGEIHVAPGIASLKKAERETDWKIFDEDGVTPLAPMYPQNLTQEQRLKFKPYKTNIKKYYPEETNKYRCALHPFPLSELDVMPYLHKAVQLPNYHLDLNMMQSEVLYSAIWHYTQQPLYIHYLANNIAHTLIKSYASKGVFNFICIHHHKYLSENQEIDLAPDQVTMIVQNVISQMKEAVPEVSVAGVYIAAPQSKQESEDVVKSALSRSKINVFTGKDILERWTKDHFGREGWRMDSLCSLITDRMQDVLTMVEMQLCIDAAVFIRSVASSWAANVQANRLMTIFSKFDNSFHDILNDMRAKTQRKIT